MHEAVDTYLQALTRRIRSNLPSEVGAIVLGGSIVLDDFRVQTSDVDVALFLDTVPSKVQITALAAALDHQSLPCPAKGLDLVAFDGASVRASPPVPRSRFGFVSGATWQTELTGDEQSADFLIDLFVLRHHGRPLYGPTPNRLIGTIAAGALQSQVMGVIRWHRARIHDPFHDPTGAFAVLNACRAWRFLAEGIMESKTAGGKWAADRLAEPGILHAALALRAGTRVDRLDRSAVVRFLDIVEAQMKQARMAQGL